MFWCVFFVFLSNPCVATIKEDRSLYQNESSLYALFWYSVLNSHIPDLLNFLKMRVSLTPEHTKATLYSIFFLALSSILSIYNMASSRYSTFIFMSVGLSRCKNTKQFQKWKQISLFYRQKLKKNKNQCVTDFAPILRRFKPKKPA